MAANDELIWELGQVCEAVGYGKNPFRIFKKNFNVLFDTLADVPIYTVGQK